MGGFANGRGFEYVMMSQSLMPYMIEPAFHFMGFFSVRSLKVKFVFGKVSAAEESVVA